MNQPQPMLELLQTRLRGLELSRPELQVLARRLDLLPKALGLRGFTLRLL